MWVFIVALLLGWAIGYVHAIVNAARRLQRDEGKTWKRAIHDALPISNKLN